MRHTFLLEEGDWHVTGSYIDAQGTKHAVDGHTRVQHGPEAWISEGEIQLGGDAAPTLQNRYQIAPMAEGSESTTWTCNDPTEGLIHGVINVVDDCVISSFSADASGYYGVDVLRKAKDDYRSRGFAMRGPVKLSSWVLTVKRSKQKSR